MLARMGASPGLRAGAVGSRRRRRDKSDRHGSRSSSLLRRKVEAHPLADLLEGRGILQDLLVGIDDDAPGVGAAFRLQGGEWKRDLLLADAEKTADADDRRNDITVGRNE